MSAQTSGVVLAVKVDVGTRVKKGDILVELDSKEAGLRLDAANASTASQRARLGLEGSSKFDADSVADVKAAKESRDMANTDFERQKMLFESGAISKSQYDQAKSAKERADANYDSSRNGARNPGGFRRSRKQGQLEFGRDTKVRGRSTRGLREAPRPP